MLRRIAHYIRDQIYIDKIIPALMVMGWFGYIPSLMVMGWFGYIAITLVALPMALIKRRAIFNWANRILNRVNHWFRNQPWGRHALYHALPTYIVFNFYLAPAFFAIYAYHSLGPRAMLEAILEKSTELFRRYYRRANFVYPALGGSALLLYWAGFFGFFTSMLGIGLSAMTAYGVYLFVNDAWGAIKNPIKSSLFNMGIYLGAINGREWAYALFHGTITGNLGRVVGAVSTTSLLTMAASVFVDLTPEPLKFFDSYARSFSDLFSTQHVVMGGEFSGYAGPTNTGLFFFIVGGALYGWAVHELSKLIYEEAKTEIAAAYQAFSQNRVIVSMRNFLASNPTPVAEAFVDDFIHEAPQPHEDFNVGFPPAYLPSHDGHRAREDRAHHDELGAGISDSPPRGYRI